MTTKTTPLDLVAIRKHILNELDIVSWALKTQAIQIIKPHPISRLTNANQPSKLQITEQKNPTKSDDNPICDNIDKPSKTLVTITNNHQTTNPSISLTKPTTPIQIDKALANPPIDSQAPTMPANTLPEAFVGILANIEKFHLSGACYGDWVLLVDNATLTLNEKAVWHSLINKLSQNSNVLCLDIHYPLVSNEYPEYETFLQGTYSLLGFLLRLCANKLNHDNLSLKLAVLTPLTTGIELGNLMTYQQSTPTLTEMAHHANAKKVFWQLLHSY